MKAMILAAGYGKRLRPLTEHTPKPLIEVRGRTLLDYHLCALAQAKIDEVVINVAYLGHKIKAAVGDGARYGLRVVYSEEATPLETGGGIFNALPLLGEAPFLVVNADIWTNYPYDTLYARAHECSPTTWLAHLVLVPNPPHHLAGDFYCASDRIHLTGTQTHTFSGIGLYHPQLFQACQPGAFRLPTVLKPVIAAGGVSGEVYMGEWYDVGSLEQWARLNEG